jgi:hypothetical protein
VRRNRLIAAIALVALAAAAWFALRPTPLPQRPIGLFTSLPILWNESDSPADLLRSDQPPHWARAVIAERGQIVPLDQLTALDAKLTRLILAQPRALSPDENVALDSWVRGGGRLILFADPALTAHSRFAVGDPRRPQDLVMLSPILAHWGLGLTFTEDQPPGLRAVAVPAGQLPVDLPGSWQLAPGSTCQLAGAGIVATCRIGKGRVLALADAALLDPELVPAPILAALLDQGFAD